MAAPKIRFKGFSGDWEQRKLGEVAEIVGGGTPDTTNSEYWNGDVDWYSPVEIGKDIYAFSSQRKISEAGLKNSSAKLLPADKTILFTSRAGIGDVAILKNPASTNQGFQSLVVNENFDVYFLYSTGSKIKEYALKNAAGSTFLEISGKALSKMDLYVPTTPEQTAIGNIFRILDDTITLHKRKLDGLKELKKGYLQQMFPQTGERVPRIRFAGFGGDWVERKLGSFGKATGGTSIESEFIEGGRYKVISIGSYSENSTYTEQGLRVEANNKTLPRLLQKNDLTMILNDKTSSGRIIGRVLLIDEDDLYVYNQRTERIEVYKDMYDPQFLYQMLNADDIRGKIIRSAQGNTQIYVNWSAISELSYIIPSLPEQIAIGNFFRNIDEQITTQQTKLDKLKKLKAAYLQGMFVCSVLL